MYTSGWGGVPRGSDVFDSVSVVDSSPDPICNVIKFGRGFGLPPTEKFRSGHLPSDAIPMSQAMSANGNDSESGSDMDLSSDREDEVYGGQYSVASSPEDHKTCNGVGGAYAASTLRRVNKMYKDPSNLSSSKVPVWQKQGTGMSRFPRGDAADELCDSATSTEVSFRHSASTGDAAPQRGAYTSDGYSSGVPTAAKVEKLVKQDVHDQSLQNKKFCNQNMPSAPPVDRGNEIEEVDGERSSREYQIPGSKGWRTYPTAGEPKSSHYSHNVSRGQNGVGLAVHEPSGRSLAGKEVNEASSCFPARVPTFHASGLGPWCAVISYDACVRLCLNAWAKGCMEEAPYFLNNECTVLQTAFGLQHVLLQPEEELLSKRPSELVSEGAAPKPKRRCGKMKVQVRKVKIGLEQPADCSFSSLNLPVIKLEPVRQQFSYLNMMLYSGWKAARRVRVTPHIPPNGTFSQQSMAYMRASAQYMKEVSRVFRNGMTSMRNSSSTYEVVQETYTCLLRLKSTSEEDSVRMQPGSGETHVFFPDNPSDDLIIEVQDSKGKYCGRVLTQVAAIADDPSDKLRWWPMYHEPEHEFVGRIQLYINYSTTPDESNYPKCGCVAETVAYDLVLEVAMKALHFQQRSLTLHGPWMWLVSEFASYYGVSDAYTKLRYLTYVMDVATPTKDCLDLVYDLLLPVLMKGNRKSVLSHQENRLFGEIEDQILQILALVFENYKSLDELAPSGMMDVFCPATGLAAPALAPAVKLYSLLHDILSSEAQLKFCKYFQAAARKRSRRHVGETDDLVSSNEVSVIDPVTFSNSYRKMTSLIMSIKNEIFTDRQINDQHVLPSFLDLPNLCASVYSVELSSRLHSFLVACPPPGPSPPVVELVIATADFQRDLASWNINLVKGGVDAKELFHLYIILWIQDKRLVLLELCKVDKAKWSGVRTQHSTTPFVDEMYEQLKETLTEYEVIICHWPEYTVSFENAIADVEKAIIEALDKQYADALAPLKDILAPKIFGLKYVQKFAKRTGEIYFVPDELGILLNSMKRMLDVLQPKIEAHLKSWSSYIPNGGNAAAGECLNEITVMLRSKFRSYLQAVSEKLVENTKMQSMTKLKKIIEETKETVIESDVRNRMQPLKDLLVKTIDNLHSVVEPHVFVAICRGFWDRMGQEILRFLQMRENRSWYKSSRIAVSILDDIFASEMQKMLGNALQDKDLDPPRSIMEACSILCKDSGNYQDNNYYC